MSWQALGAVQERSGFVQRGEFVGYRILMAIAWYADESGVAGRQGERRACPSQQAIAERARVHVNTVASWLPRLVQAGELALDCYGSGRGRHTVYRILLPMARSEDGQRVAPRTEGDVAAGLKERLARLDERVRKMELALEERGERTARVERAPGEPHERPQVGPQEGAERAQESAISPQVRPHDGIKRPQVEPQENAVRPQENAKRPHGNPHERGQKATRVQRGDVADPLDPIFDPLVDPGRDPGGSVPYEYKHLGEHVGQRHKPPLSPSHSNIGKKRALTARVEALAEVCGMDLRITAHRRQCEQAAGQLAPYSAQTIRERFGPLPQQGSAGGVPAAWQWYVDDWRGARKGEQPRPRDVVANISRQRVATPPEQNLGPAEIAFRELMKQEKAREAAIHARWLGDGL